MTIKIKTAAGTLRIENMYAPHKGKKKKHTPTILARNTKEYRKTRKRK